MSPVRSLTMASCILLGVRCSAQSEDAYKGLKELLETPVITASRTVRSARTAPATVRIVTAEEIRRRGYRSLVDVLRDLPEFKVDPGSDFYTFNGVTLRGVQGLQKLVLLMDGVRISGPTNEPVPFLENYPVNMARQVEVIYGPASALYGADAFSGVVNLITVGPEDERGGRLAAFGGGEQLRFGRFAGSFPLGEAGSLHLAGQAFSSDPHDPVQDYPADYAGTALLRTGQFQTPWGQIQTPSTPWDPAYGSPLRAQSLWLKYISGGFQAALFHRYGRHTSNAANDPRFAIYNDDVFLGTRMTTLSAAYTTVFSGGEALSSITLNRYLLDPGSNYRNAFTAEEPGYEYAYSLTGRLEEQVTLHPREDLQIAMGASLELQNVDVKTPDLAEPMDLNGPVQGRLLGTDLPATIYSLHGLSWGAFAQGEWNPSVTWVFTLGARYDHHNRYGGAFTPRLGTVWTPTSRFTLKLLAGRAYLAPSPQDTYNSYGSWIPDGQGGYSSGFWHLPNPGLRPQKTEMEEVSIHWLISDHLALRGGAYISRVEDLISAGQDGVDTRLYGGRFMGYPVTYIEVPINLGSQRNAGGSIGLEGSWPMPMGRKLQASATVSYVDGRVDPRENGRKVPIPFVAPWTFRLGVDVAGPRWNARLAFLWSGRQRKDLDPTTPGKMAELPGYGLLDLAAGFRIRQGLEAFLRVDNALGTHWRGVSGFTPIGLDGTPQPLRSASLGVELRF